MTVYIRKQEQKRASEFACREYLSSLSEGFQCEGRPCDYNNYGNHLGFDKNGTPIRPYNTYEEGLMWYRATEPRLDDWVISQIVYDNLRRTQHPDLENIVVKTNEFAGLSDEGIRLKKRRDRLQRRLEERKRNKQGITVKKSPVDEPFVLEFDTGYKEKSIDEICENLEFI